MGYNSAVILPSEAVGRVRAGIEAASRGLVNRESLVELVVLGAVAGEHLLVVGQPGTAKSLAVRQVSAQFGGRYFEYLLGRFTEPSELFGPVDLNKLREGTFETRTEGMLPEAEIAFLDEVFRGSTAILNTLLGILNERSFRRGATVLPCPLQICIGATNQLPEDETLAAFADRFLLQIFLDPVEDALLEELLENGWSGNGSPAVHSSMSDLDALAKAARKVDLSAVRAPLADAIRTLRNLDIAISDRRIVRVQRLVAAACVLAGRSEAEPADLWPIIYAVPGHRAQEQAREALREQLERSRNESLRYAVEEASAGPEARASRLLSEGKASLERFDQPEPQASASSERLRLEAVAREIDASFAPDALPGELGDLRAMIARRLDPGSESED